MPPESLTLAGWEGIHGAVNNFQHVVVAVGLALMPCVVQAQGAVRDQGEVLTEEVPAAVVESALKAVAKLGEAVVQGRYNVALERMNPQWKQRVAQRVGGMDLLEDRLRSVATEMTKRGITMVSCKPQGKPVPFGVKPKRVVVRQGGDDVEQLVYSQWLVLVPTATHFRVLQTAVEGEAPRWVNIESTGFQVAVTDRDELDWTFIDGAGLTVNDLRTLFSTLPQDMQLPLVGNRETR